MPHWPKVLKEFPQLDDFILGETTPLARISELFDVLNNVTVSATVAPMVNGEQTLLLHHHDYFHVGDLVIFDRGYQAFWIFQWFLTMRAHFCIRMTVSQWSCTQEFVASGRSEALVELTPCNDARRTCEQMNLPITPLWVRLVRVDLPTGQVEVLCTSLLDCDVYPAEEFSELYHLRWPVEEKLKRDKWRAEIENFSGKSGLSVYQDFHATIFSMNLAVMMAAPTKEQIAKRYAHRKDAQKVNWASGISAFKKSISKLVFSKVAHTVERLHRWFVNNVIPIRPGRQYPRNHKTSKRKFYITYKQCT